MDKEKGRFLHTHLDLENSISLSTDHVLIHKEHWDTAVMMASQIPAPELPPRFLHTHAWASHMPLLKNPENPYVVVDREDVDFFKMNRDTEKKKGERKSRKKNPPKSRYQILKESST